MRGYEVSKGHYVRIEDAELEEREAEANSSIDLKEFIPLEKSTPIYFESSYYDVGTKALISPTACAPPPAAARWRKPSFTTRRVWF